MSLIAFAATILPGKREQWDTFIAEITGPRRADFNASRRRQGVRERTFLQETPVGDFVLVTLDGTNPVDAIGAMAKSDDEFMHWFVQQVQEIHGFDLRQPQGSAPRQILDTVSTPTEQESAAELARPSVGVREDPV